MKKIFTVLILISYFLSFPYGARGEYLNNEVIVIPENNISSEVANNFATRNRIAYKKRIDINGSELHFEILELPQDENKSKIIAELRSSGLFKLVEPNDIFTPDYTIVRNKGIKLSTNDREFERQYYLELTKVTSAWFHSTGAPNMPIAVLDSGIDYTKEDLSQRLLPCINVLEGSLNCNDLFGHGTKVASIIGSQSDNNKGIAGISWLNPILPIKVSNERGIATLSSIISGINEGIKNNAKIIVISLSTSNYSEALRLVIDDVYKKGALIISSGGNTGQEEIRYPAGYTKVIGVGATDSQSHISFFSTTGPHIDIVAPGESILVELPETDGIYEVHGTSFSAPQIGGIAALIWAANPGLSNAQVKRIMFKTAKDLGSKGYDKEYGYGLIDAKRAVKTALSKR